MPVEVIRAFGEKFGVQILEGYGLSETSPVATFNRLDLWDERTAVPVQPAEDIYRRYYFRFPVEDRPHVIADITGILGNHSISLASVIQHEAPEVDDTDTSGAPIVPLVIMTHRSHEGKIRAASDELNKLACVRQPWVCMPVSD